MTGFPWIDAVMRQLRTEGWIHHVAQQAVGCFLTRGCLWISWEEGFKVIILLVFSYNVNAVHVLHLRDRFWRSPWHRNLFPGLLTI